MGDLIKAECRAGVGKLNEQCYYRAEDFDAFFGKPEILADACPESLGEESCTKILNKKKEPEPLDPPSYRWLRLRASAGYSRASIFRAQEKGTQETGTRLDDYNGVGGLLSAAGNLGPIVVGLTTEANLLIDDGDPAFLGGIGPELGVDFGGSLRAVAGLKGYLIAGQTGDEGYRGTALAPDVALEIGALQLGWRFNSFSHSGPAHLDWSFAHVGMAWEIP